MAVFVDRLRAYGLDAYHGKGKAQAVRVGNKHGHRWCHLFADTPRELLRFARALGLKIEWFDADKDAGHFDLNPTRRCAAIRLGAVEVTDEQAVGIWRRSRAARPPGSKICLACGDYWNDGTGSTICLGCDSFAVG
jgi:hypothetical protein